MAPQAPPSSEPTPPLFIAIAAITALAPFVVQTATLVLSGSVALTLLAGALAAALVAGSALAFQAREAGGWRRVSLGSRVGIVLAVLTYHAIAYPVARIVDALFFHAVR